MGQIDQGDRFISKETRRTIKRVISSALIVALGVIQGPNRADNLNNSKLQEALNNPGNSIGFVDFYSKDGNDLSDAFKLLPLVGAQSLLDKKGDIDVDLDRLTPEQQDTLISYAYLKSLVGHGDVVIGSHQEALGTPIDISKIPKLNLLINPNKQIARSTDQYGNRSFFMESNIEEIEKFISMNPNTKVWNLSLQIGHVGVVYTEKLPKNKTFFNRLLSLFYEVPDSGKIIFFPDAVYSKDVSKSINPIGKIYYDNDDKEVEGISEEKWVEIVEKHKSENTEIVKMDHPTLQLLGALSIDNPFRIENYRKLVNVVNKFPNIIFVISAGNYGDVYPIEELPKNLVLACRWDGYTNYKGEKVYQPAYDVKAKGMFCVENKLWVSVTTGTSNSAPIVSALLRLEMLNGKDPLEAVESIKKRSELVGGNYILGPGVRRAIINEIVTKREK